MLYYFMLYYIMLCYAVFMLCYVMLCYVMLCYVMSCYVMLCYVMLCYVMLCYVMLCYVMLHVDQPWVSDDGICIIYKLLYNCYILNICFYTGDIRVSWIHGGASCQTAQGFILELSQKLAVVQLTLDCSHTISVGQ